MTPPVVSPVSLLLDAAQRGWKNSFGYRSQWLVDYCGAWKWGEHLWVAWCPRLLNEKQAWVWGFGVGWLDSEGRWCYRFAGKYGCSVESNVCMTLGEAGRDRPMLCSVCDDEGVFDCPPDYDYPIPPPAVWCDDDQELREMQMVPSELDELRGLLDECVKGYKWDAWPRETLVGLSDNPLLPRLRLHRLHLSTEGRAPWTLIVESATCPATYVLTDATPKIMAEWVLNRLRSWAYRMENAAGDAPFDHPFFQSANAMLREVCGGHS